MGAFIFGYGMSRNAIAGVPCSGEMNVVNSAQTPSGRAGKGAWHLGTGRATVIDSQQRRNAWTRWPDDDNRLGEVVRAKEKIGERPKHKPSH